MRLIDADKAMERERMTGNCRTCNHYIASLKECGGGAEGEAVCQFLRSAFDTVDAEPVRHGSWKKDKYTKECSECKSTYWRREGVEWNYCPECGAKMDLEEGEENGRQRKED